MSVDENDIDVTMSRSQKQACVGSIADVRQTWSYIFCKCFLQIDK